MHVFPLPSNDCIRKLVVGLFVIIRLCICALMFVDLIFVGYICFHIVDFCKNHMSKIGSSNKNNEMNFYIAFGIAIFIGIVALALVILIIFAICSVRNMCSAIRNFGVFFVNFLKNYIYPEEVQDEHIAGLYSEEDTEARLYSLQEESKEFLAKQKVGTYL